MLEWLNHNISLPTLLWLFPITFLLHDFEEILFVEAWFKKNYSTVIHKIPDSFKKTFHKMSYITAVQFALPVLFQFITYSIATYIAVEHHYYPMFTGFNLLLLIHVFMHIGQSLLLGVYALGVGTAVFVTLPYSLYLFYRLLDEVTIALVYIGHKIEQKLIAS